MQELKCPDCGYLNPDIRELGYRLPWTCGKCPHIWRLQDFGPLDDLLPQPTPTEQKGAPAKTSETLSHEDLLQLRR